MSRAYKFHNPEGIYFVSFATVAWADVFTRECYTNILIESIAHCVANKGLKLHAWCIMTNHVHLIASTQQGFVLSNIMRDLKKFTSKQLITAITNNPQESRKEWLLATFANAGEYNANNKNYQFWRQDNKPIELWSNDVIDQKINYIHNNPVVAGFVAEPHYWKYSSAIDFSGGKGVLMLTEL